MEVTLRIYCHIISRKYGNKGVEIAKKAYYNIYGEDISNNDILSYLRKNISRYTITINNMQSIKKKKSSLYKEVTSEIFAKNFTNSTEFTIEFVKLLKEMIKNEKT